MTGKNIKKNRFFFDFVTASSIVTLIYIAHFRVLLFASKEDAYYLPVYGFLDYIISLVFMLGLSILCFLAIRFIRKIAHPALNLLASFLVFLALLNPVCFVVVSIMGEVPGVIAYRIVHSLSIMPGIVKIAIGILVLIGVVVSIRCYWQLFRAIRMLFVITSPFAALVMLQLSWHAITSLTMNNDPSTGDRPRVASLAAEARRVSDASRVLVLVFDDLDYRVLFPERPAFVRLPEFDKLSRQALNFTNALSLSTQTLIAIPTLLVGKPVHESTIVDGETLMLHFGNSEDSRSLSALPNLFSEAQKSGKTLSIAGTYHPYCRLFGGLYKECLQEWRRHPFHWGGKELLARVQSEFLAAFPYPNGNVERVWSYGVILQRVKEMVSRFDVNLIFLHILLPHRPIIFDAKRGSMTPFNFSPMGYFDNLVLTDNFLGEIRRAMESAGLWDGTAVLVTTDHPWRNAAERYDGKRDRRLPMLLKMSGQKESMVYEKQFSPEHVKDLVLSILAERVSD
ncbi:MAG TPA: hypothetical protein VIH59_16360, partial [Candidatus Tectomicrobia bacterium]